MKWIKVFGKWERGTDSGNLHTIINIEKITSDRAKTAIDKELKSWSGRGKHTISSVQAGPFFEDEQSLPKKFLSEKTIYFNN